MCLSETFLFFLSLAVVWSSWHHLNTEACDQSVISDRSLTGFFSSCSYIDELMHSFSFPFKPAAWEGEPPWGFNGLLYRREPLLHWTDKSLGDDRKLDESVYVEPATEGLLMMFSCHLFIEVDLRWQIHSFFMQLVKSWESQVLGKKTKNFGWLPLHVAGGLNASSSRWLQDPIIFLTK